MLFFNSSETLTNDSKNGTNFAMMRQNGMQSK
jgi:hypothetical protein